MKYHWGEPETSREFFEQFAKKSFGRFLVAATLYKDVEHVAFLVHGSPQIVSLATDGEKHLVQMPLITTMRTTTTQFVDVGLSKFQAPLPNRFIRHHDPTLCQKFFDRTENGARSAKTATQRD